MTPATTPLAGEGKSRLRQARDAVARNLGWLVAGSGVRGLLSLVYLAICTRTLGLEGFGRFALITTASQAIVLMMGFQTWQIVVQFGMRHLASGDEAALARLLRVSAWLDVISAGIGIAIGATILYFYGAQMGIRPGLMRDTMIFLVVQLVTIRSMPTGILRLRDRFADATYADSMLPVVRLIGAVLAAAFVPTVKGFLYAWMAAELFTCIAMWIAARRVQDLRVVWRARASQRTLLAENPGIYRYALWTNLNTTLGMAGKQLPLLLVGGVIGTYWAGAFRLAAQLAQALAKLSQLLTRAAFPEMVRAVSDASSRVITRILGRTLLGGTAAAAVILLIVATLGEWLLVVVGGPAFGRAWPILLWLGCAGCLELATVAFEPMLMALHRAGFALAIRACSVVAMLGAMWPLIARFGAEGASMAVFVGAVVTAALTCVVTFAVARRTRPAATDGMTIPPQ